MMNIALTNLGQYNEGILNYTWLSLPATEEDIEEAFAKINVSYGDNHCYGEYGQEYEESFITDYECDYMRINEYDSITGLNEIAEKIEGLFYYEADIVKALLNEGYDLDEALVTKDDCILYDGCHTMTDVAERYANETGLLERVPEDLQYYFDFEAYGRDLNANGHYIYTENGYIEILK